jgi:hypothetical protein
MIGSWHPCSLRVRHGRVPACPSRLHASTLLRFYTSTGLCLGGLRGEARRITAVRTCVPRAGPAGPGVLELGHAADAGLEPSADLVEQVFQGALIGLLGYPAAGAVDLAEVLQILFDRMHRHSVLTSQYSEPPTGPIIVSACCISSTRVEKITPYDVTTNAVFYRAFTCHQTGFGL